MCEDSCDRSGSKLNMVDIDNLREPAVKFQSTRGSSLIKDGSTLK
jgi:hypothetical protein